MKNLILSALTIAAVTTLIVPQAMADASCTFHHDGTDKCNWLGKKAVAVSKIKCGIIRKAYDKDVSGCNRASTYEHAYASVGKYVKCGSGPQKWAKATADARFYWGGLYSSCSKSETSGNNAVAGSGGSGIVAEDSRRSLSGTTLSEIDKVTGDLELAFEDVVLEVNDTRGIAQLTVTAAKGDAYEIMEQNPTLFDHRVVTGRGFIRLQDGRLTFGGDFGGSDAARGLKVERTSVRGVTTFTVNGTARIAGVTAPGSTNTIVTVRSDTSFGMLDDMLAEIHDTIVRVDDTHGSAEGALYGGLLAADHALAAFDIDAALAALVDVDSTLRKLAYAKVVSGADAKTIGGRIDAAVKVLLGL